MMMMMMMTMVMMMMMMMMMMMVMITRVEGLGFVTPVQRRHLHDLDGALVHKGAEVASASHVTRHTSHVTRHTSHVTHHTSPEVEQRGIT